jgi:hypothetical protein
MQLREHGWQIARAAEREDLRELPICTIDGADARDFDDAVLAEPDSDPDNHGGFKLIVAIADVAWYVRPDDALDREAYRRGNSTYFPDRVEPMLPEVLSNGLCSLKEGENRACLAVRMVFDKDGRYLQSFGSVGKQYGQFARPKEVAADRDGNVYVVDAAFGNFQIFNPDGELLLFVGDRSERDGPAICRNRLDRGGAHEPHISR